ncbi:hypothetical protein [Aquamicrobium sp.]|uniref:hypothetical protein n=1 Tax=Aquamicrobium sp. TaxID=1872579 RepID=UPI00258A617E|nr:hypothetical protein [Aquamicrobium sp.]MCK9549138.1 hypothetical protein [Aquamicrobium sp.]
MVSKLEIFNAALDELGHEILSDTGEGNRAAQVLARLYDKVVADCLAEGSWNFAMETIKAESDTGVEPAFGFRQVFAKPSDWVRTFAVSEDEYFTYPLLHYYDDANYWSADNSPIYIRYVSNDTGLGLEMSRWPAAFRRFVELELAARACMPITQNASLREDVEAARDKARKNAKSHDAMNEPQPRFPPPSPWTQARAGRMARGDRGSRGRLIG